MKKLLSILLSSIMIISATGCQKTDSNSTPASADPEKTTSDSTTEEKTDAQSSDAALSGTLKVWLDNDDWAAAVIEGFNKIYPDVTIEYENIGSVDQRAKVTLDGPAGIGPDVFIVPHDHMALTISDGISAELPADLQTKYEGLINSSSLDTVRSDGKLFGVPISTENIALFYNKDLWGAEPPKTFEEIFEFAKTYNNEAENKYAIRWQVDDAYHNYWVLTTFGYELFGPNHDDYKLPNFDTEAVKQGLAFHNSFREIFNVNVSDAQYDNTVAKFQAGEVPVTISGPWAIADAKNNGVNFGVAKLPTYQGKQPVVFSGNIIANVSSFSENQELAFAFLDFLATEEGAKIMYNTVGKMTALKDISNIPGLKDDVYFVGIQEQSQFTNPMPLIPEMTQAWDAMKALFTFTWDKQLTIEEAQAKALETYKTALQAAGKSLD